jgi:hypothetical protein
MEEIIEACASGAPEDYLGMCFSFTAVTTARALLNPELLAGVLRNGGWGLEPPTPERVITWLKRNLNASGSPCQ